MRIAYDDDRALRFLKKLASRTEISRRHLTALSYQDATDPADCLYQPKHIQPRGPGMGARNAAFLEASQTLMASLLTDVPSQRVSRLRTLITASCTHASSPGIELPIGRRIGLPPDVQHWNLGFMGCSAGLSALRLARSLNATQHDTLAVCCELSSLHFQYSTAVDQITANMLFADGAAAVWLSTQPSPVEVVASAVHRVSEKADQMVWFADDCGLRLDLSPELPRTLAKQLFPFVDAFLASNGLGLRDVRHWAVHPGGPQILDSTENALALRTSSLTISREILREFGNMSSATILFILQRLMRQDIEGPCVALAFGPGLTIEACLLHFAAK